MRTACWSPTAASRSEPRVRSHEAIAGMLSGAEAAGQMRRLVRELRTEAGGHRPRGDRCRRRRVHRRSAGLRPAPGALPRRRLAAAPQSPQALRRREHLQPADGAAADPVGDPGRRSGPARRVAIADAERRQSGQPLDFWRRSDCRQPDCRRVARADARRRDLPADAQSGGRSVLRRSRAPRLRTIRHVEHRGLGVRAREARRRSPLSRGRHERRAAGRRRRNRWSTWGAGQG